MTTEFIDEDLLLNRQPKAHEQDGEDGAGRMAKQKRDLSDQMAGRAKEIEELRLRQEALEREKGIIIECARKQEQYEKDKTDITRKLNESMILLEKEENKAVRMCELLSETREHFKGLIDELNEIDEDAWPDEGFQAELDRALVRVSAAKSDYRKALAKIDAVGWHKGLGKHAKSVADEVAVVAGPAKWSFVYWLKVGVALTLPLTVCMLIVYGLVLLIVNVLDKF